MKIKVINRSKHILPEYSTLTSAGIDLRADLEREPLTKPLKRILVTKSLLPEIPIDYETQIRPGSSHAVKNEITVLNSQGSINADHRGEVCVILVNLSGEKFVIKNGESICRMIIAKREKAEWISTDSILDTKRGNGGFGYKDKI